MTRITKFLLHCEFLFLITLHLVNIFLVSGFECLKDSVRNSCSYLCFHIAVILVRKVSLNVLIVKAVLALKIQFYFMVMIVCFALLQK